MYNKNCRKDFYTVLIWNLKELFWFSISHVIAKWCLKCTKSFLVPIILFYTPHKNKIMIKNNKNIIGI